MYLYLVFNVGVFISSLLTEGVFVKIKISKRFTDVIYYMWCCVLLLFSAFRFGIGTDYYTYLNIYDNALTTEFDFNLFVCIIKFLRQMNMPFQIIIILASCLFLIPMMYLVYKINYEYKFFSLGILIGFSYYVYSYNVFRQYSAIGLLLLFFFFYYKTNRKLWLVTMIFPVLIHPSSGVAVALYWLINKVKISYKSLGNISAFFIIVFLVIPQSVATQIVKFLISTFATGIYSGYATTQDAKFLMRIYYQSMEFIPKVLIIPCLLMLPRLICLYENDKEKIFEQVLAKIYYFYFLIMSFKFGSEIVSRFLTYFAIVGVFVIPQMFIYVDLNSRSSISLKRWLVRLCGATIILVSIYYQIKWMNGNACAAYPYVSIFNRSANG